MALTLHTDPAHPCTLEECLAALDHTGFEPDDPNSVAHAAHWLARLAANRAFLGDLALSRLQAAHVRQAGQGYTAQVMMLGAPRPGWFMRAAIWPSAQDAVMRDSGAAAFVYGLPHDHNFHFLTVGYHGPGYRSDHYEVDPERMTGVVGEAVDLRFIETSLLHPGRVMHYRARRDVHCQYAPDTLSVSINLMHSAPGQRWTDQFEYDLRRGTISRVLTGCTADTLCKLATALSPAAALDVIETIARSHPVERLRWSAIRALAAEQPGTQARADVLDRQAARASGWLARRCRAEIGD
ncbi:MAG: transposase [Blastomonas fulva]|uniref:transposase n=1 Tax=Blastomonas fulva TaxID=1550728 RepID=UPI0040334504